MKVLFLKYILILLLFSALIFSCEKLPVYPDKPEIHYKSSSVYIENDSLGRHLAIDINFTFIDGMGNLGLDTANIEKKDTTDLYFIQYNKINGKFTRGDSTQIQTFLIPYLYKTGKNKILRGEIKASLLLLIVHYDTIRYNFYLIDRNANISNVDSTPVYILTPFLDSL